MAELLLAEQWAAANALAVYLRDSLPEGYYVVAEPRIQYPLIDAVVVGLRGILMLHAEPWEGEIQVPLGRDWVQHLPSGETVQLPNPAHAARKAVHAMRAFMRDHFAGHEPAIRYALVLIHPEAHVLAPRPPEPPTLTMAELPKAITGMQRPSSEQLLDRRTCLDIAMALRDQSFSPSQLASEPFVFRSGGFIGGHRVRTVRAAIEHIDRHPEDGLFHLRNGTLEAWLRSQGAVELANLARTAAVERGPDPRMALEKMMIATGLVPRPRLLVRPRRLQLGWIPAGQSRSAHLQLRKRRGRGYLYGTCASPEPWLRVEPNRFNGGQMETTVTVDTEKLPISPTPVEASLLVDSSASEQPVAIPVRFTVVGRPSTAERLVWRPLAGFLSAALLGGLIGLALDRWGTEAGAAAIVAVPIGWGLVITTLWALLGAVRGALQPGTWPVHVATLRWMGRALAWSVGLALVALAALWLWSLLDPVTAAGLTGQIRLSIALYASALGAVPATLREVPARTSGGVVYHEGTSRRRPLAWLAIVLALLLVVLLGGRLVSPILGVHGAQVDTPAVWRWVGERWTWLDGQISALIDRLYLRYYDRRAPLPTPSATPQQGETE